MYGIVIGASVLIISLASMTDYSIPYLAPFTPFKKEFMRDSIIRFATKKLGKNIFQINKLNTSKEMDDD